jgi:hypothetical protein
VTLETPVGTIHIWAAPVKEQVTTVVALDPDGVAAGQGVSGTGTAVGVGVNVGVGVGVGKLAPLIMTLPLPARMPAFVEPLLALATI